jgi:hypothetical protein
LQGGHIKIVVYPPIIVKNKMKKFITAALLILIIGNIEAVDIDSYQFIDHLRLLKGPGKPEIYEDAVLFTASSSLQRVGISFAHESYAIVHWFKRLLVPKDPAEFIVGGKYRKNIEPNQDSGITFHLEPIPENLKNMDYRMVIDGLWTADPLNSLRVTGPTGVVESRIALPERSTSLPAAASPGIYRFNYSGPPGETVNVGGSFNNWDPFMYELKEISGGFYSLALPLPPGVFQYLFFHRGQPVPDPANPRKLYTRDGRIVSEATVY